MAYGVFASYYDILTKNVNYKGYAKRVASLISEFYPIGKKVLVCELACGTLSLGLELEKLGMSVLGTDLSGDMLSRAKEKIQQTGSNISVLKQDMQGLCLHVRADAVVCSLDALNHLPSLESVQKTFSAVYRNLKRGGLFIFDMNTPYKHREILGYNTFFYDTPEVSAVWQNEYREEDCSVGITLDFFAKEGGVYRRYTEKFRERAYPTRKIIKALGESGFKTLGTFDGLRKCAPLPRGERILYVARRI